MLRLITGRVICLIKILFIKDYRIFFIKIHYLSICSLSSRSSLYFFYFVALVVFPLCCFSSIALVVFPLCCFSSIALVVFPPCCFSSIALFVLPLCCFSSIAFFVFPLCRFSF